MPARRLVLLDAPSNLGLRPPAPGAVPGVYKLAGALRDQGLLARLGATDGGVVVPPRYVDDWQPGGTTRNEAAIGRYSRRLADRIGAALDGGGFPVVLGGDCSILLGGLLALRRRGRHGLVYVDAHADFRHEDVRSAAGEDLALVTGRGGELANLDGLGPLVAEHDVVAIGVGAGREELDAAGIAALGPQAVRERGAAAVAREALAAFGNVDGAWIHCDFDVLDSALMPAVDTPEPGGLDYSELTDLLRELLSSERAVGVQLTIYDPDLDEEAEHAPRLADCVVDAFAAQGRAGGGRARDA